MFERGEKRTGDKNRHAQVWDVRPEITLRMKSCAFVQVRELLLARIISKSVIRAQSELKGSVTRPRSFNRDQKLESIYLQQTTEL